MALIALAKLFSPSVSPKAFTGRKAPPQRHGSPVDIYKKSCHPLELVLFELVREGRALLIAFMQNYKATKVLPAVSVS